MLSKLKRLEPKILVLLRQGMLISEISKLLKISGQSIKEIAINNKINRDDRIIVGAKKRKTERTEQIYSMILSGAFYSEVGKKFGVSRQRINQIAQSFDFSRWKEKRKYAKEIIAQVKQDIRDGMSYNEILKKHENLNHKSLKDLFDYKKCNLLRKKKNDERKMRNKIIITKFKEGGTAKEIIASNNKDISEPNKITNVSYIYRLCTKKGIRRYPKIQNRNSGHTSESDKILRLIAKLRDKKRLSFNQISAHLNTKGNKTISGKTFSSTNTYYKYLVAKELGF